jgi:hypothetical protein
MMRFYGPADKDPGFIWRDKTPNDINKIDQLKKSFPLARFVIRDPRAHHPSLSVRRDWGKGLYRTANQWVWQVEAARVQGRALSSDYLEVLYEQLLERSEEVLNGICNFLGLAFSSAMPILSHPAEDLGDTRGSSIIVRGNRSKYQSRLSTCEVWRVEEIAFDTMQRLPYRCNYARKRRPLTKVSRGLLKAHDAVQSARCHIRQRGVCWGLMYLYRLHEHASA